MNLEDFVVIKKSLGFNRPFHYDHLNKATYEKGKELYNKDGYRKVTNKKEIETYFVRKGLLVIDETPVAKKIKKTKNIVETDLKETD